MDLNGGRYDWYYKSQRHFSDKHFASWYKFANKLPAKVNNIQLFMILYIRKAYCGVINPDNIVSWHHPAVMQALFRSSSVVDYTVDLLTQHISSSLFVERAKECVRWGHTRCAGAPRAQEEAQMCSFMSFTLPSILSAVNHLWLCSISSGLHWGKD